MIYQGTITHDGETYFVSLHSRREGENFNRLQVGSVQTVIEKIGGKWQANLIDEKLCQIIGAYLE